MIYYCFLGKYVGNYPLPATAEYNHILILGFNGDDESPCDLLGYGTVYTD
jgi:hypothetical protein